MKVYAVLHGQTDMDAGKRIQGTSDLPLTDTGKAQAQEAAGALQQKGIDMILTSPQKHALETAEIIAEHLDVDKGKITKGMMLYERKFGDFEGEPVADVDMFALCSWSRNSPVPNGETIRETAERVINYMNRMFKIFRTKTMLLVIHEHVLRVLFWLFNGLPESGKERLLELGNCLICEFDTDDIPEEMLDFQAVLEKLNKADDDTVSDPGRLLTQNEIDALIAELSGG